MKKVAIVLAIAGSITATPPAFSFPMAPLQVESPVIAVKKGKGHGDHDERFEHRHHRRWHQSHRHHRYERGWHHSGQQNGDGGNRNQPNGQN
jgi:hypothetical protein